VLPTATITTKDGFEHPITPEDALWAARAVSWESFGKKHPKATDTDESDVLWAITQRYARWREVGKDFDFIHSTRTFSQPLSPKWASKSASGCRANPSRCTEAMLARREEAKRATWEDLARRDAERGTRVVETVRRWAHGKLPNSVPTATNFAVPSLSEKHIERNEYSKVIAKRGGHWYISDSPASKWDDDHVQVIGPPEVPVEQAKLYLRDFTQGFVDVFTLKWWG